MISYRAFCSIHNTEPQLTHCLKWPVWNGHLVTKKKKKSVSGRETHLPMGDDSWNLSGFWWQKGSVYAFHCFAVNFKTVFHMLPSELSLGCIWYWIFPLLKQNDRKALWTLTSAPSQQFSLESKPLSLCCMQPLHCSSKARWKLSAVFWMLVAEYLPSTSCVTHHMLHAYSLIWMDMHL